MSKGRTPVSARWLHKFSDGSGCVEIVSGRKTTLYYLKPIPSDFGRAFRLEKYNGEHGEVEIAYNCCLEGDTNYCDCLGFERYGYCKHPEAIKILLGEEE